MITTIEFDGMEYQIEDRCVDWYRPSGHGDDCMTACPDYLDVETDCVCWTAAIRRGKNKRLAEIENFLDDVITASGYQTNDCIDYRSKLVSANLDLVVREFADVIDLEALFNSIDDAPYDEDYYKTCGNDCDCNCENCCGG